MAEVDARIPMGVNLPVWPTVQSVEADKQIQYRNQLAQLQVQQAQQEQQSQNAMLDVFKQPGAIDPNTGMPTQATVGKIMQMDPNRGMQLQNNLAAYSEKRQADLTNSMHQGCLKMQIGEKQHETMVDAATSAQDRYDTLVASGTPSDEAARIAGQERNTAVSASQKAGILTEDQAAQLKIPFNSEQNKALIAGSVQYKTLLAERNAAAKEQRAQAADEQKTANEAKTPFMKEIEAAYGKDSPEYQKALQDRVKKETTPTGTAGQIGSREAVYVNRALSSANMAVRDLSNIARSPSSVSSGVFGGRTQGPSLLNASKEVLANELTSSEVQQYNVKIAGLTRNLATLESQGLAPSGSLTHQMDAVVFKEGDTNFTKAMKLAEARQIVESSMEVIQANDRAPKSAKDLADKIVTDVTKAIPFTIEDLDNLQASKNKKATINDFVNKQGAAKASAAPQAALDYLAAHPEAKGQFQQKYGYLP